MWHVHLRSVTCRESHLIYFPRCRYAPASVICRSAQSLSSVHLGPRVGHHPAHGQDGHLFEPHVNFSSHLISFHFNDVDMLLPPPAGVSTSDLKTAITRQVEDMASALTPEDEIRRVKKAIRMSFLVSRERWQAGWWCSHAEMSYGMTTGRDVAGAGRRVMTADWWMMGACTAFLVSSWYW